jgi:hypothetical protein
MPKFPYILCKKSREKFGDGQPHPTCVCRGAMQPIFDWHSQVARGQPPFISQVCPARTAGLHLDRRPSPPSRASQGSRCAYFSRNSTHSANCHWRAEGGGAMKKCLTPAFFWPSANEFPWREGGCILRMPRVCKTRRRRAIHFLKLLTRGSAGLRIRAKWLVASG